LKREIITTSDGSKTIHLPEWNEQYHSKHGAIQEAYHVFIKHGLNLFENQNISVLEIGFGTGLNALITLLEAEKKSLDIHYVGVEAYPVVLEEVSKLNYIETLKANRHAAVFEQLHVSSWGESNTITSNFLLEKREQFFDQITDENAFDLIYFDAFGARVQPELWTESMFQRMYTALKLKGVLVTYSAKGSVRRAMQAVGFSVERLPGPPGKREMLRAVKED
jgi:tRNA U34 5-methylaminomethyl-2-thiouridine-forming methyltransferase MnmC